MTVEENRIRAWGKTQAYKAWKSGGGAGKAPFKGGGVSGPAVQPILADLETARANVVLNTAPTDVTATNALNAAITKLNALKSEDVTAIVALCNSAKANIALLTTAGDTAALADIANAKTQVSAL